MVWRPKLSENTEGHNLQRNILNIKKKKEDGQKSNGDATDHVHDDVDDFVYDYFAGSHQIF